MTLIFDVRIRKMLFETQANESIDLQDEIKCGFSTHLKLLVLLQIKSKPILFVTVDCMEKEKKGERFLFL